MGGIGRALGLFISRKRNGFERALASQATHGDEITKFLMDLRDVRGEQGLDTVQTVVNDSLIMSNPMDDICVLNHDILKFVDCLLQLIDIFIESCGRGERDER